MDRDPVAVLGHPYHLVDVPQGQLGVDSLAVEVERQRDDVHVAGALAVAEEGSLHALGTGQHRQLRGRNRGAPIVVRMNAQDDAVALPHLPVEPLDLVGVDVGSGHLHRGRQVEDDGGERGGLPDLHDRLADLHREVELGGAEALRGVLRHDLGLGNLCAELLDQLRPRDGDVDDTRPRKPEDHSPLQAEVEL